MGDLVGGVGADGHPLGAKPCREVFGSFDQGAPDALGAAGLDNIQVLDIEPVGPVVDAGPLRDTRIANRVSPLAGHECRTAIGRVEKDLLQPSKRRIRGIAVKRRQRPDHLLDVAQVG